MNRARDLAGYGAHPPDVRWPGGAGLALNFVINVEEGSEYSIGDGDGMSESALSEVRSSRISKGDRDLAVESMYEYGSRVGFWRLLDQFKSRGLPATVFASAQALERSPEIAQAIADTGWDICAHGWRWVEQYKLEPEIERVHIARAYDSILNSVGRPPKGWYCRYSPSTATRGLVVAHGGYAYDSDAYNDDIPYWTRVDEQDHLIVPYTMTMNDTKFLSGDVYTGTDFASYLINSFDVLHAESAHKPRIMSVGLHPRIIGHPGRLFGLMQFMDHVRKAEGVWITGRDQIAEHWRSVVPVKGAS
ncbi:polysaccharide deacetylase family protein [Falsihalocynthiibacter sp. BN13B15]|uniref:polysaccharide deacetylase family protein n=1 Tax=Falsihalocynthiibacter sp. BN13B15 TaxID=3240871 RepID=UPI00350ECEB9